MTLAGVPALKVPDNWPDYDLIVQRKDKPPERVQVRSRRFKAGGDAFVSYFVASSFEWLAVVLLQCPDKPRRIFLIPRTVADARARLIASWCRRSWNIIGQLSRR